MATIVIFLLILTLLVLVHEFGHFWTARKFAMRVYEFGMGFPPRAIGVYKDPATGKWVVVKGRGKITLSETVGGEERREEFPTTLYSLNWLPIGGFCKIKGESGEDGAAPDSFAYHRPGKRLVVLVAGVAMNILLAAALLSLGFMIGLPTAISDGVDPKAVTLEPVRTVVQQVLADSPAESAGFKAGDRVLALDAEIVASATSLTEKIKASGIVEHIIQVERDGELLSYTVSPSIMPGGDDIPRLGLHLADVAVIRYPWYQAIPKGFLAAGTGLINIFVSFYLLLKNLLLGNGLIFDVSGPVGIASVVGESARLGFNYLLNVTAMISLSLAAINILPIPALDGGRALFVTIEKIFRRPVPMKYEQLAHTIGFLLLMALIVVVTARDIAGLVR